MSEYEIITPHGREMFSNQADALHALMLLLPYEEIETDHDLIWETVSNDGSWGEGNLEISVCMSP